MMTLPGLPAPKAKKAKVDYSECFARALATRPRIPAPVREYTVCPWRLWRFDFAFMPHESASGHKIAIEIGGGTFVAGGGRHNEDSDREKLAVAAALGFRVIRFSQEMLGVTVRRGIAQITRPECMCWCLDVLEAALFGGITALPVCPAVEARKAKAKAKAAAVKHASDLKQLGR